jgi:hypothetical protein
MAKKTKKYADGGDVYEGTDLARAMGVRGVPEPGLEAVYPEQSIGGVGSIKGVGGSAMKAAEEAMIRKAQEKAFNRANRFASGKIRQYSPEEKMAEAARLRANVNKIQKKKEYTPRASEEPIPNTTQELTGKLGGKGGLKFDYDGMEYKKGGAVKAKKMASGGKVSSASKRADGCATKGKTKGRMI